MDYAETIRYLEGCHTLGSKKGHKNLKMLLDAMGCLYNELNIIHIAGTNGKGSTSVMLYSILRTNGYNTALFTSPHLIKYNERLVFNDEMISDTELADYVSRAADAAKAVLETNEYFSFFEIMTACAFAWFCDKKPDFAVVEVGLGGRLDATNVIKKPLLSVITNIGIDHTEFLGDTLEKIALEKSGIIKKNCPTVLYCQSKEVYNIIKDVCKEKASRLYYALDYDYNIINGDFFNLSFDFCYENEAYKNVELSMYGYFQIKNACNALICAQALMDKGVKLKKEMLLKGLKNAKLNARMEIISNNPLIILDGAHNMQAAEELMNNIEWLKKQINCKVILLAAFLKNKNIIEAVNQLNTAADGIILTQPHSKRAENVEIVFKRLEKKSKCLYYNIDCRTAVKTALKMARNISNCCLIVCGSLYLAGDIKKYLKNGEE